MPLPPWISLTRSNRASGPVLRRDRGLSRVQERGGGARNPSRHRRAERPDRPGRVLVWFAAWLLAMAGGVRDSFADEAGAGREFFETRIRPVLVQHCYPCHSAASETPEAGLRLDTRDALRAGGDAGPVLIPGDPDDSELLAVLRHESSAMPPDAKLPDEVVADFERWIAMGAPDPRDEPADADGAVAQAWNALVEERRRWWSLQPVVEPAAPPVENTRWSSHPIDRFILAELEARGLQPSPRADRRTLIRRLAFALTGLPPSPEEVARFVADDSPDAWPRLVDRMLASPHFGERWARHWMDVIRYTDTYGYEWDIPAKGAWRYRDYLIRAFNADVPFDQLIREQIAGDLLEVPRRDPVEQINESLTGLMFFQMGEKRHGDSAEFNGIHQEMLDNKIDAFSKAFQALTISCARCHDHKLDPIAQRDYYALGGVFMSSRWVTNTLDLPERNASLMDQLSEIKRPLRTALAEQWMSELASFPEALVASSRGEALPDHTETGAAGPGDPLPVWRNRLASTEDEELPLEDALYPWARLVAAVSAGESLAETWRALANRYAEEHAARAERNARQFEVVADFRQGVPEGWSVDGVGLRNAVAAGDFTVALEGPEAVGRLLPGGRFTHALSPRLNGVLRTPVLNRFDKGFLSFEYVGGDFSAHRTIVDNAFLTERQGYLDQPSLGWLPLSTHPTMRDRRIAIELATKTSNPNFPPRVGLGGECSEEQARDPRSWFGVSRVLLHDTPEPPADELARFTSLWVGEPPRDLPEAAARHAEWLRDALRAWSNDEASDDDVGLINWMLDNEVIPNRREVPARPEIAALVERYRALEARLATPQTVNGMAEIDPGYDYLMNIRGDYDQLGAEVPRGYLAVLSDDSAGGYFDGPGSGRRELAELVASPHNPLTARVFVNRVWHWLFGAGLVATPDDFGHLGASPSHPELLDYLASRFMAEGWSLKRLVRTIVLTETWQQSGETTPHALTVDPENRLRHHFPPRRLEAEAIRDAMLWVSGRLDRQLFGPPVDPPRANEDPQKRLFSGPLDGLGRRSLYTKVTIMEPPRFLAIFNQPTPKIPTGKRDVTTTPAQSLAMMNDPFVTGQAEFWANRLVAREHATVAERLEDLFPAALGRPPTAEEAQRWSEAVADFAQIHGVDRGDALMNSVPVWRDVAHALFNLQEFRYVR